MTTPLQSFKRVCHKYLVLHDDVYIDVVFGSIFANRLDSKPVWLYLVGPPSSGKTEILQALGGEEIYPISKLTRHTLISGWEDAKRKQDNSLAPKLNGKVMVIKDFTAMIRGHRDALMEITGQLRDIYDGTARNTYGTGKDTLYTTKFGIIAGITNVLDKHRGILTEVGERFLTYRIPFISDREVEARCWKASSKHSVAEQEAHLKRVALKVLNQTMHQVTVSESFRHHIIQIASYIAKARCEITRDQYTKEPEIPIAEIPTRLTQQLCDLAIGIAIARNRRYISREIQALVQKTALDCLTLKRLSLLSHLYKVFPDTMTTQELAIKMRFSESIVRRWLEDLFLLNLIERKIVQAEIGQRHEWKIKYKSILHRIWK